MLTRTTFRALAAAACGVPLLLASVPASATNYTVSGTLGGTYPVSASAMFSTSGSTLTLTLMNTSTTPTVYGAQVLTSFYFDMLVGGTVRPTLTYQTGSGSVFKVVGGGTASMPFVYVPPTTSGTAFTSGTQPSNIKSSSVGDNSWYFRQNLNEALPPYTRFGIGTVGNSGTGATGFTPNNFPAQYVDGIDFGIFTGNLTNPKGQLASQLPYLVKDSATFTFTADRDLSSFVFYDPFVFGFGTEPDQTITITPEPTGMALAASAALAGIGWFARRRKSRAGLIARRELSP